MQISTNKLQAQQQILAGLLYYAGPIDGVWGPDSIKAMKKYEAHPDFLPCVPNNGMPMRDRGPYPMSVVQLPDGTLHHPVLDDKQAIEMRKKVTMPDKSQVGQSAATEVKKG